MGEARSGVIEAILESRRSVLKEVCLQLDVGSAVTSPEAGFLRHHFSLMLKPDLLRQLHASNKTAFRSKKMTQSAWVVGYK